MKFETLIQNYNKKPNEAFYSYLKKSCRNKSTVELRVAMAYVTVAGLRELFGIYGDDFSKEQWLIGMSDYVSHPDAFRLCMKRHSSQVRYGVTEKTWARFHPKIIFSLSETMQDTYLIVGSNNLTISALKHNIEAGVALIPENEADLKELKKIWNKCWKSGSEINTEILIEYESIFKKKSKSRIKKGGLKKSRSKRKILESDLAISDPSLAKVTWIECGKITANGRELEFKSEQGLFFGFDKDEKSERRSRFLLSDGSHTNLRFLHRGNDMLRLEMTTTVPEVANGLRKRLPGGGLKRSEYVAVFEKLGDGYYKLYFVLEGKAKHQELMNKSLAAGAIGSTTARRYGWF